MIRIPSYIDHLQPYIAGKPIEELAREKHLTRIVKLASNENPLGSSPKAIEAVRKMLTETSRYVDPGSYRLVHALAQKLNKRPEQIICGSGVDALLGYIIKGCTAEGDEVLTSEGTFIGIYVNTRKHHRNLVQVPLHNYGFDLAGILEAVTPKTRVIYLANPNNPTGTIFTRSEFESFMAKVTGDILVILDEAYTTYASADPSYPNGSLYNNYDNLLVARTFSKDYGLAGLRLGYAVAPEYVIRTLYKVKLPFEPNCLAQEAGIAALDDDEFLRMTIATNARSLSRMRARFAEIGIDQVPTHANFILLLMPSEQFAVEFNQACLVRGLIVRHVKSFGVPNGIRINSGTDDETEFALEVIGDEYTRLKNQTELHLPGRRH
ncbi:MAG TPA: histidinol-phosphate transaminase [Candidatus Acidoferrum sp.]|nr:histidinol-phosphate transaminase [Candidatus Acidoferrum sp.]